MKQITTRRQPTKRVKQVRPKIATPDKRKVKKALMHKYQVEVLANFTIEAHSPTEIRQRFARLLKTEGFSNKGWEIRIRQE